MTVRITKPEFNLREKLSELDKPTGLKGNELMRSETTQEARDVIGAGRRNLIINGDMRIWQRTDGAAVTGATSLKFGPDRWMFEEGCDNLVTTMSRSTDTPSGQGFKYSFQLSPSTVESTHESGDFAQYMYFIEGYDFAPAQWGNADAKPCTLSFWFKTSMGGQHYVTVCSSGGVDVWSTSITSIANAWEHHAITIPPPTTGTWNTTSGRGLEIRIGLMESPSVTVATSELWYHGGSAYNGFADAHSEWAFSTSNNAYLTGVQLEIGSQATPFEHRPYAEELALCQRYFTFIPSGTVFPGRGNSGSSYIYSYSLPVPLRASPTVATDNNLAHGTFTMRRYRDGTGISDSTSTPTTNSTYFQENTNMIHLLTGGFTGADDRSATLFLGGGAITLSAEL